jgi:hypothetical protein
VVTPKCRGAEAGRQAAHAKAHHDPPRRNPARQPFLRKRNGYTLGNARLLASRGYVALTPGVTERDTVVTLTEAGRQAQDDHLSRIGPEIRQLVSEIPTDQLQTAYRVLHEIRLVLDNLPDR